MMSLVMVDDIAQAFKVITMAGKPRAKSGIAWEADMEYLRKSSDRCTITWSGNTQNRLYQAFNMEATVLIMNSCFQTMKIIPARDKIVSLKWVTERILQVSFKDGTSDFEVIGINDITLQYPLERLLYSQLNSVRYSCFENIHWNINQDPSTAKFSHPSFTKDFEVLKGTFRLRVFYGLYRSKEERDSETDSGSLIEVTGTVEDVLRTIYRAYQEHSILEHPVYIAGIIYSFISGELTLSTRTLTEEFSK